jgi:hypothetical protein
VGRACILKESASVKLNRPTVDILENRHAIYGHIVQFLNLFCY